MEDLLKNLLAEKSGDWTSLLTEKAGFATDQAKGFLPAVMDKLGGLLGGGGLDLGDILGGNMSDLLKRFDLGALAGAAGVGEEKAAEGLQALLPSVLETAKEKTGGLEELLGTLGGDSGKSKGLLGGVASKLFGK